MESKKGWAFVAQYNGKKVKKYVTTCEKLDKHEWISKTKFWFRDENYAYYEGILLAKEDDEQTILDLISKKIPRCPHNAFNPFPDPDIKPIETVEKWKKKLAMIAMNDFSTPNKRHEALGNKEIPNHAVENTCAEITNLSEGNESTMPSKHEASIINHRASFEETELRHEGERMVPTSTQLGKDEEKRINQIDEVAKFSETSSEEDKSFSNSKNVIRYVGNGRKTLSLTKPEKITNHSFVIYSKNLEKNKIDAFNDGMISKKKYNKLLQKYKLLKLILSAQKNKYSMDLRMQQLALCLYKTIEARYNEEEEIDE